jgi:hypothetical protein
VLNIPEQLTKTLDRLETQLPPPSGSLLRFNRSLVNFSTDQACRVTEAMTDSLRNIVGTTRSAGKSVADQSAAAGNQVAKATRSAGKSVADQSAAAGNQIADSADRELNRLSDDLTPSLGRGTRYENWTKTDLYERASELDIAGRSGMSKTQLIAALRSA